MQKEHNKHVGEGIYQAKEVLVLFFFCFNCVVQDSPRRGTSKEGLMLIVNSIQCYETKGEF